MKKIAGKLILLMAGTLFSLGILEIGFRIILPPQEIAFSREIVIKDQNTGQTIHTPNLDKVVFSNELEKEVRIFTNNEGFVGKDYSTEKPENTIRIAVLGDSYVAALQVDTEKNFVSLLEKKLNGKSVARYEVMNFGIGGQGTVEEILRYHYYVKKYRPDIVLLAFYPNDFENNQYYLEHESRIINHEPIWDIALSQANNQQGRTDWKYKLMKNSYLARYMDARVRQNALLSKIAIAIGLQDRGALGAPEKGIHPQLFVFESPLKKSFLNVYNFTGDLFAYLNEEVKKDGGKLVVIYIPMAIQIDKSLWEDKEKELPALKDYTWDLNQPNTFFKGRFSVIGIPFLDLSPRFSEFYRKNSDLTLYNGREGHFNEKGHEIMADELFSFVKALP